MSVYKIVFTPSGPYFFGNEKKFVFREQTPAKKDGSDRYFIRGENTPEQSTLFGAMRYLLLPEKGYANASKYSDIIGENSFGFGKGEQSFGIIKSMSPVFICKDDEIFIPTPFDHIEEVKDVYSPFDKYLKYDDERIYSGDYAAKSGLADSYMSLEDFHIEMDLFSSFVKVGINRKDTESGFFKKEYKQLKKGFAFAVLVEIDENAPGFSRLSDIMKNALEEGERAAFVAMIGQDRVPFAISITKQNEFDTWSMLGKKIEAMIREKHRDLKIDSSNFNGRFLYFASSTFVEPGVNIYENVKFAVVKNRDYRAYGTKTTERQRGSKLFKTIKAGSLFIVDNEFSTDKFQELKLINAKTDEYNLSAAKRIGFNHIVDVKIGE